MRVIKFFLMACFLLVSTTGCSLVIEKIQQVTGNEVKNVSEKKTDIRDNANEEKQIYEQEFVPPTPSPILRNILEDEGKGRYATESYKANSVAQALQVMPEGLAEDAVYAYLLGLVGQNYKYDLESLSSMLAPNYQAKIRVLSHGESATPKSAVKPLKPSNIAVLVDASSTMADDYKGKSRYEWAKLFAAQYMKQLPANSNFIVHFFGHQGGPRKKDKEMSCSKTETVYQGYPTQPSKLNKSFDEEKPTGWSPLVEALHTTMNDLVKNQKANNENIIYVIADSSDTCGADITQQIEAIRSSKMGVMVNVIGIDVPTKDENELTQLAEATGGEFQPIEDIIDLEQIARVHANEVKQINEPWQVRSIQKMVKGYQVTQQRLNRKYLSIVSNLNNEHKRLSDANTQIRNEKKINPTEYKKIKGWIDNRYEGVLGFTEQKMHAKEAELKQSFSDAIIDMDKKWKQNEALLKPFEKKKKGLLGQAEKVIQDIPNSPEE
jgi:Ca-activated chloride channel homolog